MDSRKSESKVEGKILSTNEVESERNTDRKLKGKQKSKPNKSINDFNEHKAEVIVIDDQELSESNQEEELLIAHEKEAKEAKYATNEKEEKNTKHEQNISKKPVKKQENKNHNKLKQKSKAKSKELKERKKNKDLKSSRKVQNSNKKQKKRTIEEDEEEFDIKQTFLPGQKHIQPPIFDPTRAFYESLLNEKPESKIAQKYFLEYGLYSKEEATAIVKLLEKSKGKEKGKTLNKSVKSKSKDKEKSSIKIKKSIKKNNNKEKNVSAKKSQKIHKKKQKEESDSEEYEDD